ncbi:hypothetical protein DPPLL_22250 [Desulfofustis limnaeus]|uniref:Uncharacterized protein n=1 Tax=Desulfofustis limnaeus TaxID=2740163 RepID=A0ABM7WAA0_9BACT|nr:hypothetical protein DPPLL_22250 [Desulfofustis limnaeus]
MVHASDIQTAEVNNTFPGDGGGGLASQDPTIQGCEAQAIGMFAFLETSLLFSTQSRPDV